ncbi:fatty acid desaturase family protein [Pajaroellobacter abortibovis]|uniref:Fatty acid desaturase domain-containing protein n=1 Tax=Pajaroellobacter abortibovis TaxID=1882918 RepID=A0A1L6MWS0_9BACT|nr:fatty acid desaturase [Pajaroellobacter abortibovis]APR99868.1 hypothetical protein BCY86_03630 [Pajaroellobacter abortibovis]
MNLSASRPTVQNVPEPSRTGKALVDASRAFAKENPAQSWWYLLSTLSLLIGSVAVAAHGSLGLIAWVASFVTGLLIVRMFILYHDFMHGAILRSSPLARVILYTYGLLAMTPPRVWRDTHDYHHAHTSKIVGSHIGSFAMVTTAMWQKMSTPERLYYRIIRHPLTILFGYFTIFMYGMCIHSFLRSPHKNWDSAASLLLNWSLTWFLITQYSFLTFLCCYGLPMFVATAIGAYLFYAQHNFPSISIQPREHWLYTKAALESSSYMKMNLVMSWFTGNIGYHHVHHLNPRIPFYRLPEAMNSIPELQNPCVTGLSLSDIIACFKLKVWDPDLKRMVSYREASSSILS